MCFWMMVDSASRVPISAQTNWGIPHGALVLCWGQNIFVSYKVNMKLLKIVDFFFFFVLFLPGPAVTSLCQAVETWTWEPAEALTPQCGTCRTYLSPGCEDTESGVNVLMQQDLPFSIITLPYSCCEDNINSVVWIEGEGQAARGEREGRQGDRE